MGYKIDLKLYYDYRININMSTITQGFGLCGNNMFSLYKQEQNNLEQCREKIRELMGELSLKDTKIRDYEASIKSSTRYINRLESVNVELKDQLIEEKKKTKSLEIENVELNLKLENDK